MKEIKDIYYTKTKNEEQSLDLYLPENDEFDVFLYFHGGGIESGSKKDATYGKIAQHLTEKGYAVVSAEYRKYPGARFPEFLYDAAEVVAWVVNNISSYGKMKKLFVGGSSAGAYITMMLCFDKKYLESVDLTNSCINGYIHDAPQPTTHFNVLRERGIDTKKCIIDEAAPLYHIGDLAVENVPPMLLICSVTDMACRYEQMQLTYKTLLNFGFNDKVKFLIFENSTHCKYVGEQCLSGVIDAYISGRLKEYQVIDYNKYKENPVL